MEPKSWCQSIVESFKSQMAIWFVGVLIGLLTLFSSKITEDIRLALNNADLRSKYYEGLASGISEYRFDAELAVEFVDRGWTTAAAIEPLFKDYNESITKIRGKEWVYESWIRRYWGKKQIAAFEQYMESVRAFDSEVHNLNDEIEAVAITKTKTRFDPDKATAAVQRLKPALVKLQESSTTLNRELE